MSDSKTPVYTITGKIKGKRYCIIGKDKLKRHFVLNNYDIYKTLNHFKEKNNAKNI